MVEEPAKVEFSAEAAEGIMAMLADDPAAGAKLEEILGLISRFDPNDHPEGAVAYCFVCTAWFDAETVLVHDADHHEHEPQMHSEQSPLFGK